MGASALRRALLDEIERRGEDGGGAAEGEYDGRESDHDASLFDRIEALLVTRPTRPRHALCLYTMGIEGFDIDFEADYFAISSSHVARFFDQTQPPGPEEHRYNWMLIPMECDM